MAAGVQVVDHGGFVVADAGVVLALVNATAVLGLVNVVPGAGTALTVQVLSVKRVKVTVPVGTTPSVPVTVAESVTVAWVPTTRPVCGDAWVVTVGVSGPTLTDSLGSLHGEVAVLKLGVSGV